MIEKKQRENGQYYFLVKAQNGQILVESYDYESESARDNGISLLKKTMQGIISQEQKTIKK